ncbi:MAG: diguanylate cyclase [Candidatus Omnitrophota bacterium]
MAKKQTHDRFLLDHAPVAIIEWDYGSLKALSKDLSGGKPSEIRNYLAKHAKELKAAYCDIRLLSANRPAFSFFGVRARKRLTEMLTSVLTKASFDVLIEQCVAVFSGDHEFSGEMKCRAGKGRAQDVFIRVVVPQGARRDLSSVIMTLQDITAWKRVERRLRKKAQIDGLTGLFNQSAINEKLDIELVRAKRYGLELSCMMIDMDFFKVINDKFGHQKGDQILKKVAVMIQQCFRKVDVVGRYGGDEFTVILPETSARNANFAAQRLQRRFAKELFRYKNVIKFHITLSIGIAGYKKQKSVQGAKDLIAIADNAMYDCKKAGRNQIKVA